MSFVSLAQKEPVFLHWSPQVEAYFSEELHVPCGDFTGHVIVEGKTYPVEAFSVRSYTFEVDLFLKEGTYTYYFLPNGNRPNNNNNNGNL